VRLRTERVVDADRLPDILAPRTGFVRELPPPSVPGSPPTAGRGAATERQERGGGGEAAAFELRDGPVRDYRRMVEVEPLPDQPSRVRVRQTVEATLAAPLFWWFFWLPARLDLGRLGRPHHSPFWAPPQRLDTRAATALDALAGAALVTGYLGTVLTQTFTFAANEFGVDKGGQGLSLAIVRADVVVALVLVAMADRRGRRGLLLFSAAAGTVLTATGALAPSVGGLVASQVVARGFVTAAGVLIGIVAVEEMPAGSRAYAVSLLTMAGALGAGVCVMSLPLADVAERAWRVLYVVPLVGLPVLVSVARHLPESKRFGRPHRDVALAGHGKRLWLLATSTFLLALFTVPASQFQNEFLRDERGFSAARISLFTVLTATPASIGIVVGGRLADVRGRRLVGAIGILGGVGFTVAMFASHGWPLWGWSVVASVIGGATVPALGVYGPELFPTSLRGKANGLIFTLGRVGSIVGLVAVGVLSDRFGTLPPAFALMALGPLALAVLILVAYPETAGRELEELNPEDA
jgi:MFS family permease